MGVKLNVRLDAEGTPFMVVEATKSYSACGTEVQAEAFEIKKAGDEHVMEDPEAFASFMNRIAKHGSKHRSPELIKSWEYQTKKEAQVGGDSDAPTPEGSEDEGY